ncbi:DUF2520 domain-containing protein [Microbacterium gorillae]|uniref:DUF2520 domain-containing protein n=1 Tax=Microbacterium gorillae TaxID=1231063 RepID=UPI00058EE105|nr:DUF2520 domain-containing protein [Microbacterium gorillae]
MTRDGRLGIGVIGAGQVGPVVAAALAGAGHAIVGITPGSDPDRVAAMLPDVPHLDAVEVARRSELVIIAVPTAELSGLISGLASVNAWQMGQLVMHTDPAFGVEVFAPARALGIIPLAVHPAITFTGTSIDLRQLPGSYAAVTAPGPVQPIAQALAVEMGCEPVIIAEEDRPAYAEAVATIATFSAAVVRQSADLLRDIGIENPGGYLSALARSTVDRALTEAGRTDPDLDGLV